MVTTPASIRREVRRVRVHSCADGTLRVEPEYVREPLEPGGPALGLRERIALGEWMERVMNRELEG